MISGEGVRSEMIETRCRRRHHMRGFFLMLLSTAAMLAPARAGLGQKKEAKCEDGPRGARNWEQIGRDYVYFDYVLCPADVDPPGPLVRVWITTRGQGIALERWAQDREGADSVAVYDGKKKAYTLFRDLKAVPLKMLKAERRSGIPAEVAGEPFMVKGLELIPLQNLTPDSGERVKKVFAEADTVIKKAGSKVPLLFESSRIGVIAESLLDHPPKPLP
jgi:hypothetical protein